MGMMNRKAFSDWKPGQKVKPVLVSCEQHGVEGVCKCPVKQEYSKEADINHIMKRYPGGVPYPSPDAVGTFMDVSEIGSLSDMMRRGDAARDAFNELPAKVRARFGNDAYAFLEFLGDRNNYDEAVKLGLVVPKELPAPSPTPEVTARAGESKEVAPAK